MLPLRQVAGGLWTVLGFMLVAALVLNMRYKPMGDGASYLDTWTGETHAVAEAEAPSARAEVERVEGIVERARIRAAAPNGVRFAFPAPERRIVIVGQKAAPGVGCGGVSDG
ncbi:MAG: hypothetical protein GWN99_19380 [Gemmatimonadetes bacterium]|uniref:Uncharacterized protein n=1 Tax=Candidatus Kutchimonas denitrificans TaxID=3056748 RepID=A0AAE5CAD5_9BACT|nr:hypothetical protein [Gemmatimonadota bacterium]NIR76381.1 hypothetical protein [Candidatus Kutchimonas denitrificans]NIS03191.1 hypothetical protein [Gemmatimonadota bacterium]NIT66364.1 hypothetical protein [Gemmatimonadota bacterium]NIU54443.1 hypothetical protein [Gemmatimonadota bacterium]